VGLVVVGLAHGQFDMACSPLPRTSRLRDIEARRVRPLGKGWPPSAGEVRSKTVRPPDRPREWQIQRTQRGSSSRIIPRSMVFLSSRTFPANYGRDKTARVVGDATNRLLESAL